MIPSKEEWEVLQTSPMFQALRQVLRVWVEEAKEEWARGIYTAERSDATVQLNAEALGRVGALMQIIDIEYDDIERLLSDERE